MGYIINPPFSTKDKIPKPELEVTDSEAYRSEEARTAKSITQVLIFLFGVKCLTYAYGFRIWRTLLRKQENLST